MAGLGGAGTAALAYLGFYFLRPVPAARLTLMPARFDQLSGWGGDAVAAAIPAFLRSCSAFQRAADNAPLTQRAKDINFGAVGEWRESCAAAADLPAG